MENKLFESANEACLRLNISAQTLYAYVSRGLILTSRHPLDSRKRLYASVDIDRLVHRQERGRSRRAVATSTIDFGEPVLRSHVSSIKDGQFYYHNQNAVTLSKTVSLEDIFERLCNTSIKYSASSAKPAMISEHQSPLARFVEALAFWFTHDTAHGNKHHAYQLLKLMASNAAQEDAMSPEEPIHQHLARAWTSDPKAADLIRRALVLSADHELNASTYAARVTASAGASLSACLLTGISTLSGSHHGGLTSLCLAWMRKSMTRDVAQLELSDDSRPPGFGHRLYPDGDPRALEIVKLCPAPKSWNRIAKKVAKKTKQHPTLDYGLATLEHQLKLPKGSGVSIFAVGRTVGWLAHCFEQRKHGGLIRPRAS